MNPDATNLLAQLRDIHGAPPTHWWPPAPGWWLLSVLLLLALAWGVRRYLVARSRRLRRQRLLDHLDMLAQTVSPEREPRAFLAAVNALLKLVALRAFPERDCAPMRGAEWVAFLSSGLADDSAMPALEALAEGPYQPQPRFDADSLASVARQWIRRHG
jgi:hypothetical protein